MDFVLNWLYFGFCFELALFWIFWMSFLGYQLQNGFVQTKRLTMMEQKHWHHKTQALKLIQKLSKPFPTYIEKEGYRIFYRKEYHAYHVVAPDATQVTIYRPR